MLNMQLHLLAERELCSGGPASSPQTNQFRRAETNAQAAPIRIVNCKL